MVDADEAAGARPAIGRASPSSRRNPPAPGAVSSGRKTMLVQSPVNEQLLSLSFVSGIWLSGSSLMVAVWRPTAIAPLYCHLSVV